MIKQLGGSTGAVVSGACCLGFAPLLAGLSAVGAGFLIRDAILIPLFVLSLAFTLWSLWSSRAKHGQAGQFYLGLGGAVIAFAALWFSPPLAYLGLAGVLAAAVWDIVTLRHARGTTESSTAEAGR